MFEFTNLKQEYDRVSFKEWNPRELPLQGQVIPWKKSSTGKAEILKVQVSSSFEASLIGIDEPTDIEFWWRES